MVKWQQGLTLVILLDWRKLCGVAQGGATTSNYTPILIKWWKGHTCLKREVKKKEMNKKYQRSYWRRPSKNLEETLVHQDYLSLVIKTAKIIWLNCLLHSVVPAGHMYKYLLIGLSRWHIACLH